jgi:diketogulonate reductase-like aldo/keto reductase
MVPSPAGGQWDVIETLERVAGEAETDMAAAALAWARSRPGVTSTLIGARSREQLAANLASLEVTLDAGQLASLNEVSAPQLNFPAANNATMAPMLAFGGMTVDGESHPAWAALADGVTY